MPYSSRRWPAISRVLMPRAYIETILSSKPGKRRWYLAISCGSKLACRSRGTASSILPVSVTTVLRPYPLRLLPAPSSPPRWWSISAFNARSASAFFSSSSRPFGSKAVFGSAPASSWSRMASGILGSLRRGMSGLLRSHHARPHTKFPTGPLFRGGPRRMLRPRHLDRPPDRPQRLPAALDRHRGQPELPRHPRRGLAAAPQPAVGRRLRQAGPQPVEQFRLRDRRSRPVAPSQVAERVRTPGVVAGQQLLDPPHPERGRRGHLGRRVPLRQQPDRLDMPGRAGVRRGAEPLPQLRHARVSRHLRHVSASREPRPSLPAASRRRNRHRTHQPETVL